jgi:uncharacterized protein YutE (UPF0331/DUF86 family)
MFEKILKIIGNLEKYFNDLKELNVKSAESLTKEKFYSLSMILFAILNRAIDLGEEIVRENKMGIASSYKEIFQILNRNGVISNEVAKQMEYLVSMRNVLAHEYFDVTEKSIYEISKKINSVELLTEQIKTFISRKNATKKIK